MKAGMLGRIQQAARKDFHFVIEPAAQNLRATARLDARGSLHGRDAARAL